MGLTTEQKAKAYDEAIKRAKEFEKGEVHFALKPGESIIHWIFPELRESESEDERIRKWLIKTIHLIGVDKDICADQETMDKAIAWLEKQKINTEGDFGRGYDCGYQAGYAVAMNEPQYVEKELAWLDELRTRLIEEEIPTDLKEAAEKWSKENTRGFVLKDKTTRYVGDTVDAFIAGAKWQAERLLSGCPLPEDTVLFNKGVAEGKRLMMEETVEGEYDQYPAAIYLPAPIPRMNQGDKIKIIIVKED